MLNPSSIARAGSTMLCPALSVANGDGIFYEQLDTVDESHTKWRRGDICHDLHPSRDVEGHIE